MPAHLKKHGLRPVNQGTHANKGRISEIELRALVEGGATQCEMAEAPDRSVASIRHWLAIRARGDGGKRRALAREARRRGQKHAVLACQHHGLTKFVLEARGYFRCMKVPEPRPLRSALRSAETGVTRSFAETLEEARKCLLLCSNCHAEVESGVTEISTTSRLRLVS